MFDKIEFKYQWKELPWRPDNLEVEGVAKLRVKIKEVAPNGTC